MLPLLVVILGPTAIGKSALSLQIAEHFGTEIVSADSRQIYREMQIGTAAPPPHELVRVKHHFVGTRSIFDYYSASRFEQEALVVLQEIFARQPLAVLSGGSMLYADALCFGIDDLPAIDPELRKSLTDSLHQKGIDHLRKELQRLDPNYYSEVDLKNPKRLLHALEIIHTTGVPYSTLRTAPRKERPFQMLRIGLNASREMIYQRINQRVDQMVDAGLEEEARRLYPYRHQNAMLTVGYREWFDHFDGKWSHEEAIERIKGNTRRYARKQLTWYKRDTTIHWVEINQLDSVIPLIEHQMQ